MFERLTPAARGAVLDAHRRAGELDSRTTGCAHLLLALAAAEGPTGEALRALELTPARVEPVVRRLAEGDGARSALASIGIDLDAVRERVEAAFGPGALARSGHRARGGRAAGGEARHRPITAGVKECLQLALREARAAGDRAVDAEHLALALTGVTHEPVADLFAALGPTPGEVRAALLARHRRAG